MAMVEVAGSVQIDILGNTQPFEQSLHRVRMRAQTLDAQMKGTKGAAAAWGVSQTAVNKSLKETEAAARRAEATTRRLSLAMGTLATQMSATAGAGGAAVGVLARFVGFLGPQGLIAGGAALATLGIAKLSEAWTELQNDLARVTPIGTAADEFRRLQELADRTSLPLKELVKDYVNLSAEARKLGISQEETRRRFVEFNESIASTRRLTISDGFRNAKEELQNLASEIDNAIGLTRIWNAAMNGVANAAKNTASFVKSFTRQNNVEFQPVGKSPGLMEMTRIQLGLQNPRGTATSGSEVFRAPPEDVAEALRKRKSRSDALGRLQRELQLERDLLGLTQTEAAVKSELFRLEEQFRGQRLPALTKQEQQGIGETIRLNESLKNTLATVNQSAESVFSSMSDALTDFAVTGEFSIKQMADSIIRDLLRIGLQAQVVRPLLDLSNSFAAGFFGGGTPTGIGGGGTPLPSFQHGGSFKVGGSGSGDRPALVGLEPGELVTVQPRGGQDTKVVNNIQIISSRDFKTEQSESTRPDGTTVIDTVVSEVQRRMQRGDFDQTLEARFGTRTRTARR